MIESSGPANPSDPAIGPAFVSAIRQTFAGAAKKIRHCLEQLSDEDVRWRPHPTHNSIAIVINHLCGNLRQWIVAGAGGAADVRDRPAEFEDPGPVTKEQLIERISRAVAEVDATLAAFDPSRLLERRRIQGFDVVLLHAILDTASHFVGHTHQIVYITRVRLGDAYRFEWAPATKEQGAGGPTSKT
jgi:uncharacterized damage-inducible protein DinB